MSFCNDNGIPHSEFLGWDKDDRDKVLAALMEKSLFCSLCGTAEWEWDENRHAYQPVEHFCMGCYMKESASEDAGKMKGTSVELVPTTEELLRRQQERYEMIRQMDVEDQPAEPGDGMPAPIG